MCAGSVKRQIFKHPGKTDQAKYVREKSLLFLILDYCMQAALGPLIMKLSQVPEKNFHFQNAHGTHVVKLNSSNFKVYKFINIYGVGLQSFTGDAIII